ncbi:hypothetical protein [Paenibacillus sp. WC2504]|uniref:hypothetical protein n=1 Tax=Paenibacillus sp. WC2504 TaxID=3461403 RepID=UPI0040457C59
MRNRTLWKLFTVVPFLAAMLLIGMIHMVMLAREQVMPFAEPYGRATLLPELASQAGPVQMTSPKTFAYRSGNELIYVKIDNEGRSSSVVRSVPDSEFFQSYRLIGEGKAVWIGANNKLYTSEWKNGNWSPKKLLTETEMNGVQAIQGGTGKSVLLTYNDEALFVGISSGDDAPNWIKLNASGIKQVQGFMDKNGMLSAVYATSREGNTALHVVKLDTESGKTVVMEKLKDLELVNRYLEDYTLYADNSLLRVAYTISSAKSGKSSLQMLTFPWDKPTDLQDERIDLPSSETSDSDTILQPIFSETDSGEATLVVSSVYEKNRRMSSQEVYQLSFHETQLESSTKISQFGGFAQYPNLAQEPDARIAVWLDPVNEASYRVYYATDQQPYQERMNRLTADDLRTAAENLPLLWGISLVTWFLSLKWIFLPGIYLLVLSAFWQHQYDSRQRLHFFISLAMYIVVKALFIQDYRKAVALQVMPEALQPILVYLCMLIITALLAYVSTRQWRKGLNDRNIGLELFYFVLLDVFMTNLWYSYFMSPATF